MGRYTLFATMSAYLVYELYLSNQLKLRNIMFKAVSDWFSNLFELLFTTKCYTTLFKAGIFLCISLFASGQVVFVTSLPYEKEAFALMHKVESESKTKIEHESPDELKCSLNQSKAVYNDCKNSKYLYDLSSSLLSAFAEWSKLLLLLMYVLFVLSIFGFMFRKPDESSV
jgi:hypothetical protein